MPLQLQEKTEALRSTFHESETKMKNEMEVLQYVQGAPGVVSALTSVPAPVLLCSNPFPLLPSPPSHPGLT